MSGTLKQTAGVVDAASLPLSIFLGAFGGGGGWVGGLFVMVWKQEVTARSKETQLQPETPLSSLLPPSLKKKIQK